jgi:hypothetical protein
MSAVMGTRPGPAPVVPAPATVAGPVTQVRVIRAEWTKLRALRSTWWCSLIAVVLIVGLGAAIAESGAPYKISAGNSAAGGVTISLVGILFAQLVLGVLGILLFSGEYATGMIRATLAVVPSRLPVLWAKLIVLVGLMLPVSLLAAAAERSGACRAPPGRPSQKPAACSVSCGPRTAWNSASRSLVCPTSKACSPGSGRPGCRSGTNAAVRPRTRRPASSSSSSGSSRKP